MLVFFLYCTHNEYHTRQKTLAYNPSVACLTELRYDRVYAHRNITNN